MDEQLLVGTAEVDITPPVGTLLAGSLKPRTSVGVDTPLCAKAIVLESGGCRLAYVALDIVSLARDMGGDEAVRRASAATGIPEDHIVYACSHTHTGPYTHKRRQEFVNAAWLGTLPERIAEAVQRADAAKVPARLSRCRAFEWRTHANRRVRFKDGRHVNRWLLGNPINEPVQALCTAGPIDPEVGMLAFDSLDGQLLAVMYHFTLHANSDFGPKFSADYPGIVSQRLREAFGPQTVALFMPGCCGDINPTHKHEGTGNWLAEVMIAALRARQPMDGPVALGACKRELVLPLRNLELDQEGRLEKCGWAKELNDFFRQGMAKLRAEGIQQVQTWVGAFHVGDVGFVTLPGEVFVDWQVYLKEHSPFPWTYPVELSNDSLGYLITRDAWEGGGYEALTCDSIFVDVNGVNLLVDRGLDLLRGLR